MMNQHFNNINNFSQLTLKEMYGQENGEFIV